jgi:hypothetical protein
MIGGVRSLPNRPSISLGASYPPEPPYMIGVTR